MRTWTFGPVQNFSHNLSPVLFIPLIPLQTFPSPLSSLCCAYPSLPHTSSITHFYRYHLKSSHIFYLLISPPSFIFLPPNCPFPSLHFPSSVDRCLLAWRTLTIVTWTLAVIPSRCRRYGEPSNTANRYPATRATLYCVCEVLDFSDAYQSVFNEVNLRNSF